jgi:DNA topoisomerase-2
MELDWDRFGAEKIDRDHKIWLKARLEHLSAVFPSIEFRWRGEPEKPWELVKTPAEDFAAKFSPNICSWRDKEKFFAFFAHEERGFSQFSAINGLELPEGGAHADWISSEISKELSSLIKKKRKLEIPPAEIKSSLGMVFLMSGFENPSFNSQSKEKLVNSKEEIKRQIGDDFSVGAKKIFAREEIIGAIVDAFLAREELKGLKAANKKKAKVEKHAAARSSNPEEKILFLGEGDSAVSGALPVRDSMRHGFFPLRGVPMSCWGLALKEIFANKEFDAIKTILELPVIPFKKKDGIAFREGEGKGGNPAPYNFKTLCEYWEAIESGKTKPSYFPSAYGKVAILTDADVDGRGAIRPLLLQFFFLWPELFLQKRIWIVESPMIVLTKKEKRLYFFNKKEYDEWLAENNPKGWEYRYIKGLGSLRRCEFEDVLNNSHNRWEAVGISDPKIFEILFSENVAARRALMEE